MPPLYAQFDGDEIDGDIYKLGDEIKEGTNPAVIAVLTSIGRISASKPDVNRSVPLSDGAADTVDSDPGTIRRNALAGMDPADMTRSQMVAHLADLGTAGATDDQLRDAVNKARARNSDDSDDGEKAHELPEVKASMSKADLEAIAATENITFGDDVTNNDHRVAAILEARKARSEA